MSERFPNHRAEEVSLPDYSQVRDEQSAVRLEAEQLFESTAGKMPTEGVGWNRSAAESSVDFDTEESAIQAVQAEIEALEQQRLETLQNSEKVEINDEIVSLQSAAEKIRAELKEHLDFEPAAEYDEMSEEDFDDLSPEEIERETLRHYEAFLAKQVAENDELPVLTDVADLGLREAEGVLVEENQAAKTADGIPVLTDVVEELDDSDPAAIQSKKIIDAARVGEVEDVTEIDTKRGVSLASDEARRPTEDFVSEVGLTTNPEDVTPETETTPKAETTPEPVAGNEPTADKPLQAEAQPETEETMFFGEPEGQEVAAKVTPEEQITAAKYLINQIDKGVQQNVISTGAADAAVAELENRIHGLEKQLTGAVSNKEAVLAKTDEVLRQLARRRGVEIPEAADAGVEVKETEKVAEASAADTAERNGVEDSEPNAAKEKIFSREYLAAKREFKEAQRAYLADLDASYRERNILPKLGETFGVGRKRAFNQAEQAAYDMYMEASKKFHEYSTVSGLHEKLQQRLIDRHKKQHSKGQSSQFETPLAVAPLVADRFVFNPAEKRLEVQSGFLPERLQNVKKRLLTSIKKHPYLSAGLGAGLVTYGLTVNAPGVLLAAASGAIGRRFVVGRQEDRHKKQWDKIADDFQTEETLDFEQLESEYFAGARRVAISKNRNRAVASALGISAAAAAESLLGNPDFTDSSEVVNHSGSANSNELRMPESIADKLARADRVAPMTPEHIAQFERMENSGVLSADSWSRAANPYADFPPTDGVVPEQTPDVDIGPGWVKPGIDYDAVESNEVAQPVQSPDPEIPSAPQPETPPPSPAPEQVSPPAETGPDNPAPVEELSIQPTGNESIKHASNEVEIHSAKEIIPERLDIDSAAVLERLHGYQPKVTAELEGLVTSPVEGQNIMHHLYAEMINAYNTGQFNLPAVRAEYVSQNPTALFSFIEEHARELTDNKLSAFLGGSDSLGLSPDEWRALGFSSGDPQVISPADKIQTGKLIKLILENAAEEVNSKLKPN